MYHAVLAALPLVPRCALPPNSNPRRHPTPWPTPVPIPNPAAAPQDIRQVRKQQHGAAEARLLAEAADVSERQPLFLKDKGDAMYRQANYRRGAAGSTRRYPCICSRPLLLLLLPHPPVHMPAQPCATSCSGGGRGWDAPPPPHKQRRRSTLQLLSCCRVMGKGQLWRPPPCRLCGCRLSTAHSPQPHMCTPLGPPPPPPPPPPQGRRQRVQPCGGAG